MAEAVEWRLQGIVVYHADERYGRQTRSPQSCVDCVQIECLRGQIRRRSIPSFPHPRDAGIVPVMTVARYVPESCFTSKHAHFWGFGSGGRHGHPCSRQHPAEGAFHRQQLHGADRRPRSDRTAGGRAGQEPLETKKQGARGDNTSGHSDQKTTAQRLGEEFKLGEKTIRPRSIRPPRRTLGH